MRLNIVEIVACYKLANHFVAAEAESETGFVTHSASVEHLLLAAPSRRQSVAYARILIEVESLFSPSSTTCGEARRWKLFTMSTDLLAAGL